MMKRRGIKNLIIDFGGVLIDLDLPALFREFQKAGIAGRGSHVGLYHQQDFFQKYEKG